MKVIKCIIPFLLATSFCLSQVEATSCLHHAEDTCIANANHTPLHNLTAFAVLPMFSLNDPLHATVYKESYQILKSELEKMGIIQEMPMANVKGIVHSGVFLTINVQKVPTLEHKNTELTKVSLTIETMATLKKSSVDCLIPVWTRSVFIEEASKKNIESSIENLLNQFTTCYAACNCKEPKKPTFYLYQP